MHPHTAFSSDCCYCCAAAGVCWGHEDWEGGARVPRLWACKGLTEPRPAVMYTWVVVDFHSVPLTTVGMTL